MTVLDLMESLKDKDWDMDIFIEVEGDMALTQFVRLQLVVINEHERSVVLVPQETLFV